MSYSIEVGQMMMSKCLLYSLSIKSKTRQFFPQSVGPVNMVVCGSLIQSVIFYLMKKSTGIGLILKQLLAELQGDRQPFLHCRWALKWVPTQIGTCFCLYEDGLTVDKSVSSYSQGVLYVMVDLKLLFMHLIRFKDLSTKPQFVTEPTSLFLKAFLWNGTPYMFYPWYLFQGHSLSFFVFSSKAKKWSLLIFEIQFPMLLFFTFVQDNHKMESGR